MNSDINYWDGFYDTPDRRLSIASQFATFVANEFLEKSSLVIDLGCGNGRDALFFSALGFQVVGIDASAQAIDSCQERAIGNSTFIRADISDSDLSNKLNQIEENSGNLLVYSRFFLHAITDEKEFYFWKLSRKICKNGDSIALEFRTNRDKNLSKVTQDHFRRFINPSDLLKRANDNGYICDYFVEGFGMAKYKTDDAHVARILLKKVK